MSSKLKTRNVVHANKTIWVKKDKKWKNITTEEIENLKNLKKNKDFRWLVKKNKLKTYKKKDLLVLQTINETEKLAK